MKKKILLILITVFLLAFFVGGCSGEDQSNTVHKETTVQSEKNESTKNNYETEVSKDNAKQEDSVKGGSDTSNSNLESANESFKEESKSSIVANEDSGKEVQSSSNKNYNEKVTKEPTTSAPNKNESSDDSVPVKEESSDYVYANGGRHKSNKYHSTPTAHRMEGAIKMTRQQAEAQGYVACKKCF